MGEFLSTELLAASGKLGAMGFGNVGGGGPMEDTDGDAPTQPSPYATRAAIAPSTTNTVASFFNGIEDEGYTLGEFEWGWLTQTPFAAYIENEVSVEVNPTAPPTFVTRTV